MSKFRSISLGELLQLVQDAVDTYGENTPSAFVCNYGDYGRTMQALPFDPNNVVLRPVVESAYSQSGFAAILGDDEDDEELPDEFQQVACFVYDRM